METNRLILRKFTLEQLHDLEKMDASAAAEFCGLESEDLVVNEISRLKYRLVECSDGFENWYVIEKESKRVIGDVGLHAWEKRHDKAEIGYLIHKDFQGKGYATEAAKKAIEYGFTEMNLNRIEAHAATDNVASHKVLQKLGFQYEGLRREHYKLPTHYSDSNGYGLLLSDYKKMNQ